MRYYDHDYLFNEVKASSDLILELFKGLLLPAARYPFER